MGSAIMYLRVSTSEQAESRNGLCAQEDACRAWAAKNGLACGAVRADEGVSGKAPADERPALLDAVGALQRGDVLIVAKRDRLGRDPIVTAMIERLVERKGARVVSAAGEGTDDDDPTSILMRRIVDAFAEYERLIIGARTKAALRARKERGLATGGVAPLGSRIEGGKVVDDPAERAAVATIRELRRDGHSIREIAAYLNEHEVKARGTKWHANTIARCLIASTRSTDG